MKKTNYSIKKLFKKGIATLLTASMVVTAVQAPAFADNVDEEVTESSASVTGLVHKKITLELVSDELKEAALTAIRENRLFDAQDYLAATGDNQKALREYEAFFNENPGLYVVDAPESVVDTLSGEDAELRIFVQKDAKMAKVDLTASPSEITREDSTESKNVEFRYGTDKDIILYEPASNVDTLVNGGEDAYYIEPEQEIGDNSDYELTGNEKITFMFINSSDGTVRFTLKVDGVTYDKVEVGGREAALKKIIAEAGTKKSTEETTVADETTAAEVQEVETEAPALEVAAEGTEIANADADNVSAETEETTAAVEETAAETEAPAADTDAEVKEEEPAEVTEEPETEATIPEKIAEAIGEAFGGASDAVLGRMTVYADTIVGEGVQFEVEENAPAAGDSEETEDKGTNEVVAEAVEAVAGEDTATEADEVNEETTAAVDAAADDNTALVADAAALQIEVSEGLSEDEAENQVEETVAQEVTVVETEPETVAETQAVKETIAKDDETKAAKVATASEITEYDDFALELIAEVKEEVLQDKAAAKENIKVARIAQYTINELGKIHYETEVDGFNVEVFAAKNAFGDITPTLEAKKLAKPEEAEASEDKLSEDQVAELKANNIYDNSQSLDIRFVDGFGKEVEPSETVKVRITLSDENLLKTIDATSLEVHHIKETNDTLKTEKVAATEDVKLLDKNDEEIKDSDLEVVEAGESVEVASAVAEFEVESFSVYAITWTVDGEQIANIKTYYYDYETGKPIEFVNANSTLAWSGDSQNHSVTFSDSNGATPGSVTDYVFYEARLGGFDGPKITKVETKRTSDYYLDYYSDYYYDYYYEIPKDIYYVEYYNKGSDNEDYLVARNTIDRDTAKFVESKLGSQSINGEVLYYESSSSDFTFKSTEGKYYKTLGNLNKSPIYTRRDEGRGRNHKTYADVYTGPRFDSILDTMDNSIYFVYKKVGHEEVEEETVDFTQPAAEKVLEDLHDGTYKLTLSVKGDSEAKKEKKKANVIVVLDLSYSMNENSGNKKRIDIAKTAVNSLASSLLNNNNSSNPDAVQLGLVTFAGKTEVYKPTTNITVFKKYIDTVSVQGDGYNWLGGTNWEGGLLDANGYSFGDGDKDPTYVIFVSDGKPTFRVSSNGYTDDYEYSYNDAHDVYGTGSETDDNVKRCKSAAVKAASSILNAKKKLYAVNAFSGSSGAESNMKDLFGSEAAAAPYYYNAKDSNALNSAFTSICDEINQNLAYANVEITDGITTNTATNINASTLVNGSPSGFEYDIYMTDENGNKIDSTLNAFKKAFGRSETRPNGLTDTEVQTLYDAFLADKAEVLPADFNGSTVDWKIKGVGNNKKLMGGVTYSVSFIVWPKQAAYDALADNINNGNEYSNEVATNTVAWLKYDVLKEVNGVPKPYDKPDIELKVKDKMVLTNTKLGIAKLWKMDNYDAQHTFIEEQGITLKLLDENNNAVQYKGENGLTPLITVNSSTSKRKEQNVLWTSGTELSIAPGILMSVKYNTDGSINDDRGFRAANKTTVTYGNKTYYQLEAGHTYHFDEKSHNHKFILEDVTYHPMIVDGTLKNIKFDKAGNFVEMVDMESFVAENILKFDDLTVKKQYQGNMAVLQDTKFALNLYNADGTAYVKTQTNGRDDIVELNTVKDGENTIEKIALENGVYTFTISAPTELAKDAEIVITLPADVYYDVTELNPAENAGYTTYCGKSADKKLMTQTRTTEKFKLSGATDSVNTIYFINEKKIDTPTGFRDNVNPFVVLALAGLASMVFLAYDFRKRRLFED